MWAYSWVYFIELYCTFLIYFHVYLFSFMNTSQIWKGFHSLSHSICETWWSHFHGTKWEWQRHNKDGGPMIIVNIVGSMITKSQLVCEECWTEELNRCLATSAPVKQKNLLLRFGDAVFRACSWKCRRTPVNPKLCRAEGCVSVDVYFVLKNLIRKSHYDVQWKLQDSCTSVISTSSDDYETVFQTHRSIWRTWNMSLYYGVCYPDDPSMNHFYSKTKPSMAFHLSFK